MADPTRNVPQTGTGANLVAKLQDENKGLWDRAVCPLTSIGGSANAITATLIPALTAGMVDGMAFWLTPSATNTSATTIAINGAATIPIVDIDGNPLVSGELVAGRRYLIVADGGELRIAAQGAVASGGYNVKVFTTSGTWTKPDGLVKARIRVRGAGGGGGGKGGSVGVNTVATGSGGGGGGEAIVEKLASDLGGTETVTIGAGGAAGTVTPQTVAGTGGTTSFGVHAVATGGIGGITSGPDNSTPAGYENPGGFGGVGTAGDMLLRGDQGQEGLKGTSDSNPWNRGGGGASPTGGAGGPARTTSGVGNAGQANTGGGGGAGRHTVSNTALGSIGGSGWCVVEEFF